MKQTKKKGIPEEIPKWFNNLPKLLKNLKGTDEIIKPEDYKGYLNNEKIIMVVPKNTAVKKVCATLYDATKSGLPIINYYLMSTNLSEEAIRVHNRLTKEKNEMIEINESSFSTEKLILLLKICKNTKEEKIRIRTRKDSPLWMETDKIICILAPMVEK